MRVSAKKSVPLAEERRLDELYSKASRRIVPLLLLSYIVAYLDRVNVGFAKLQMLEDLGFSETVYGLGAGIFFLGYFLFEVPSNLFLHRLGARVWISRIMISWGLMSAAMMLVTTPASFYALRFLLGVAEAGFFPGIIYYLTQWFPGCRRTKVTATFMTGIAISSMAGSLLSGWILENFNGLNGWAGWQWLFLLEALPAVLLGAYVFLRLESSPHESSWLKDSEKALLANDLARENAATGGSKLTLAQAFRDGRVWFGCLIYFSAVTGIYGIGFWLPTMVRELGFERPLDIGLLAAIPYAVAMVVMVLVGRSADRHQERRWHVAIPALVGAVALLVSVQTDHAALVLTALTIATAGILTVPPVFWSIPTSYLRGAAAAAGIAIINSIGNLAGFLAPYMVGWVKDQTGSIAVSMCIIAGFVSLAGLLVLVGVPPRVVDR